MYAHAYIEFLSHFHGDRDYFECHELLEEHWKEDERGERKIHWVGLIQIAVSLYHQRRGNFRGAEKMLASSERILTANQEPIEALGLDALELLSRIRTRLELIRQHEPYTHLNLPICDANLLTTCTEHCHDRGFIFADSSYIPDEHIVHKHMLRDRSDVIEEREKQLVLKKKNNKR
ncbi:DUF309 domain-containing protein [Priestia taiwanensis]|uniref:DUF309 domain-containing protein n=1 Tax=Priestia taiwanensis TaxID=1347902 RepID=A0A917AIM3_9BACI|nr:DUF309 domain-containing protein [Priestia taiwanensis]MBM7361495.1 putative metal-dependent hydrolase [Priestia taiwanensis]GGE54630.1 hypothetical protein GCM10007140_01170 [Priestia taiwanensis]